MKSRIPLAFAAALAAGAASLALAQAEPPPAGQGTAPNPAANAAMSQANVPDSRPDVTSQAVSVSGRKRAPSPAVPFVAGPIASATQAQGSDAQLADAIVKALDADPSLKDSKITVQPDKGTVLLTGATLTRAQKQTAGRIAIAQAGGEGKVINAILDDAS